MRSIYLDYNATAPILPEVVQAMAECHQQGYANPSSQHQAGRRARQVLEDAREAVARLLGADLNCAQPDRLLFTSGGTEANNLALLGLAQAGGSEPGEAITSAIEHPSAMGPMERLEKTGWRVHRLVATSDGVVRPDEFAARLSPRTRLASVMLANNETGVLQPVAELARLAESAGVPLHTDAVQVAGKLAIDFRRLGVSTLSISGHKFHGPPGAGALVIRHGVRLEPLWSGGFQQSGLRPGTEHVAPAVGLRCAMERFAAEAGARAERLRALRDRFEAALAAQIPGLLINGGAADRLPHTSNIAFPRVDRQALLMALDLASIACSTGSACASGSSEPSHVLLAMGLADDVVAGSLRFSLGVPTTADEIDEAARRIATTVERLQNQPRSRSDRSRAPAGT